MIDLGSAVVVVSGIGGLVISVISTSYQRAQARAAEAQLQNKIEVTISKDLEGPSSGIDTNLKKFLNGRLSDVRYELRQEFSPRLDRVEHLVQDGHIDDAIKLWSAQGAAVAAANENTGKVVIHEHEIETLKRQIDDLQNGVGNPRMVRAQIRAIAEQLLKMADVPALTAGTEPQYNSATNFGGVWGGQSE